MYTIVGLGNPGRKYNGTRHNIGRQAVRVFAQTHDFDAFEKSNKLSGQTTHGVVSGREVALLLPDTFMNKSGVSVAPAVPARGQAREELVVVHDEIDLPLGSVRISQNKSAAGHNGVASIIDALGTQDFRRVRIGIAPADEDGNIVKPSAEQVRDFVLKRFTPDEKAVLDDRVLPEVHEVLQTLIEEM